MVRERKIVAGSPDDDDDGKKNGGEANGNASGPNAIPTGENDSALRPKRISDMVGQTEVMDVIRIAMDAAKKRNEPLGHILFDGPPGLGNRWISSMNSTEPCSRLVK